MVYRNLSFKVLLCSALLFVLNSKIVQGNSSPQDKDKVHQSSLVPVHRYYNPSNGDHFYTANYDELGPGNANWRYEGILGKVFLSPEFGTLPLHRYVSGEHFYTTNWAELGGGRGGYKYEGITGYVELNPMPGTLPVFRYYNSKNGDHFYTTNFAELGGGRGDYVLESIAFYVY